MKANVPTLYFSADSDPFTQLSRSLSILGGWTVEKSAREARAPKLSDEAKAIIATSPIQFVYNGSPTLDDFEDSMRAYEQGPTGDYPELVVVDNITNVSTGGENDADPFAGLEALLDYLHTTARYTGSSVVGLHHVQGQYNDQNKPIPLSGVKNQVSRVPELILTLHRVSSTYGPDLLNVSAVKNRGAKFDPSGQDFVSLEFHGDTMQIRD